MGKYYNARGFKATDMVYNPMKGMLDNPITKGEVKEAAFISPVLDIAESLPLVGGIVSTLSGRSAKRKKAAKLESEAASTREKAADYEDERNKHQNQVERNNQALMGSHSLVGQRMKKAVKTYENETNANVKKAKDHANDLTESANEIYNEVGR